MKTKRAAPPDSVIGRSDAKLPEGFRDQPRQATGLRVRRADGLNLGCIRPPRRALFVAGFTIIEVAVTIELSRTEDALCQRKGRELGARLNSDQAVDAALLVVLTRSKNAARLTLLGFVVAVALCVLANCAADKMHGLVGPAFAVALLGGLVSFAIWLASFDMARLHRPLSSEENLCSQLLALAEQSAAVRSYVGTINASGRQLRVFDIACVNAVYQSEQNLLVNQYGDTACATLHSL